MVSLQYLLQHLQQAGNGLVSSCCYRPGSFEFISPWEDKISNLENNVAESMCYFFFFLLLVSKLVPRFSRLVDLNCDDNLTDFFKFKINLSELSWFVWIFINSLIKMTICNNLQVGVI